MHLLKPLLAFEFPFFCLRCYFLSFIFIILCTIVSKSHPYKCERNSNWTEIIMHIEMYSCSDSHQNLRFIKIIGQLKYISCQIVIIFISITLMSFLSLSLCLFICLPQIAHPECVFGFVSIQLLYFHLLIPRPETTIPENHYFWKLFSNCENVFRLVG